MKLLAILLLLSANSPPPPLQVPPPKPPEAAPLLPEGELTLVSGKEGVAFFLVNETVRKAGAAVDFWIYGFNDPPMDIGGPPIRETMYHQRFDCEQHLQTSLTVFGYDERGKMVIWLDPEPALPIRARTKEALFFGVVCENFELPKSNVVHGHEVARETALQLFSNPGGLPFLESVP